MANLLAKTAICDDVPPVLMIYLEPAPYIVGLVDCIRSIWPGRIEVLYVHCALTQPWNHRLRDGEEAVLPAGVVKSLLQVRRALATKRYGLIHLAGWGDSVLFGALLLGCGMGVPVTVETDTPMPRTLPTWKRWAKALLYRLAFRLPAIFLPAGSRQAEYLHHYGVGDGRIKIAHMTVDVAKIMSYAASMQASSRHEARHRYGIESDALVILYLGRLEPYKGLFDLFEAFQRLKEQDSRLSLLIAGDGSLSSWAKDKASAEQSIFYVGRLSGERVWEAYAISDIFVLPSHFEPWGLVVNEAMASGLPVIATDQVGCVDDLVKHAKSGLVVPAGAPSELARAMKSLASDADLRKRMSAEAKRIIAGWTLENAAIATVEAWRMSVQ